jgi:uncharacterized Ntn-hydrolase superfamily protein
MKNEKPELDWRIRMIDHTALVAFIWLIWLGLCAWITHDSFVSDTDVIEPGTWSVIALDPATRQVGIAGATCEVYAVGLAGISPGKGAVAVQAWGNLAAKRLAVDMLSEGASPQEVIEAVTDLGFDPEVELRQYGVVAFGHENGAMAYTGAGTNPSAGDLQANGVSVQGNELVSHEVVEAALHTFLINEGAAFPERLLLALEAGMLKGGDRRCGEQTALTAFLLVAEPEDTPKSISFGIVIPEQDVGGENPVALLRQQYETIRAARHPVRFLEDNTLSLLIFLLPILGGAATALPAGRKCRIKGVLVGVLAAPLVSVLEILLLREFHYVFLFERGEYYLSLLVVALSAALLFLAIRAVIRLLARTLA